VVIVRGDHHEQPETVVVGVDDNDLDGGDENESVRALRWVYTLPGVREVRVQHAWFLPALAVGTFPSADYETNDMDAAAEAIARRVIDGAGAAPDGISVRAEPVRGTPGFALIEASHEADLVVVGSRGRGGFKGLLLGSTSGEVAAHGRSPVAVIR
jgi:nucleotide-binding universal stress UspA family protein